MRILKNVILFSALMIITSCQVLFNPMNKEQESLNKENLKYIQDLEEQVLVRDSMLYKMRNLHSDYTSLESQYLYSIGELDRYKDILRCYIKEDDIKHTGAITKGDSYATNGDPEDGGGYPEKNGRNKSNEPDIVTNDTSAIYNIDQKQGKIAFYCPEEMSYKVSSDVFGIIADLISDEEIRKDLVEKVKDHDPNYPVKDLERDSLLIRLVQYYEIVELRLMDSDDSGFEIKAIHEENKQIVRENMECWHWKVTPNTKEPDQQLILKVLIYNKDGSFNDSFSRAYNIKVSIQSGRFFTNTKAFVIENPEWALTTIIVPFVTFMYGRYNSRRKKKNNKGEAELA